MIDLNFVWLRQRFQEIRLKFAKSISRKVPTTRASIDGNSLQLDGQVDASTLSMPTRRRRVGGDVCAIFVHAGAGFHSVQNERVHLKACEDAARAAMTFLNTGGEAVNAVEMAIKVLEDKEITNAGWGSNLAIDGTVECDATVVDHYGRSGAVGAVGNIRNPIHLARLLLEYSTKPLSLKRVPPNLLVGSGAVDFAYDQGVAIVPNDDLVSSSAQSRWLKWKSDLKKAERGQETPSSESSSNREAVLASCWNESQPYSPHLEAKDGPTTTTQEDDDYIEPLNDVFGTADESTTPSSNSVDHTDIGSNSFIDDNPERPIFDDDDVTKKGRDDDLITDTVGAIAVDCLGNIAAGSSSGGIGMKHRGRLGPAALVNVGTAVIPIEANDPKKTSVASVTSGTGEHMATTFAASLCASRIYTSTRRATDGGLEPIDDDGAIRAFVERDFMGHPGVIHSHSAGAIGVLGVKKSVDGVWLYFAHNTDSFAVASMGSDDTQPRSTMSRNRGDSQVITGARVIRYRPSSSWTSNNNKKISTWPANPNSDLNPPSSSTAAQGWIRKRARTRRTPSPPCVAVPQPPMQTSA